MSMTYSDLYTLVNAEIQKNSSYQGVATGKSQMTRTQVVNRVGPSSGSSGVDGAAVMNAIMDLLSHTVPPQIKSGLIVSATEVNYNRVAISAGEGTVGGSIFKLNLDTEFVIPFDDVTPIFYLNMGKEGLNISKTPIFGFLTLAKIVVPKPGTTSIVRDKQDINNPWDAWIVNYREVKLFGDGSGHFEEDSIDLLRNNIGDILADNIIGNIRLSEDLKITNTQGTVELDSKSLNIYDENANLIAKYNKNGSYLYDNTGNELARFTSNEARVGGMKLTPNTIESTNFVAGSLGAGFQIGYGGDAQFNNVTVRGKMASAAFEKTSISVVGGNLLVMDGDVLESDMTSQDTSPMIISGSTSFTVGDILRIRVGASDEWFEVTNASGTTYTVTRDKAGDYSADANPAWTAGTAIVNYKQAGNGGVHISASEVNSPYVSILSHDGTPWSATNSYVRLGNLGGFLDYPSEPVTEAYGIAIGTTDDYLKYDPVNGLRIKGSIIITGGTTPTHTYYQDTEPGSSGEGSTPNDGDFWVDTNDNDTLYVYDTGAWQVVTSGGAGGGVTSFRQGANTSGEGVPTSTSAGDLWMDTDSARLHRAAAPGATTVTAGQWEPQQVDIPTPAGSGLYLGADYMGYFNGASWTSYIKNDGDFKFNGDGSNYIEWDGATLTVRGSLTADDISAGTMVANRVSGGTLTGTTITGNTIRTSTAGGRIEMDGDALIAYDDSSGAGREVLRVDLDSSGGNVGDVTIGDYDGGNGAKWDNSLSTFDIQGEVNASSGSFTGEINASSGSFTGAISVGSAGNVLIDGANEVIKVFGDDIDIIADRNDSLDWYEDGVEKNDTLTAGTYTPAQMISHVQTLMRAAGDADTTVTYNTTTLKITIANSTLATFELLFATGTYASTSCGQALGFNVFTNKTSALTYTAEEQYALRVRMGKLS